MKSNKLVIASLFSLFYATDSVAKKGNKKSNKDLFRRRSISRLTGKVNYVGLWKPWFTVSAGATLKNVFFGVGATKHFEVYGNDVTAFCKIYIVDRTVVGAISDRDTQYFKKIPLELGASTQFFGLNLGVNVSVSENSLKSSQKAAFSVFGSLKPNEYVSIDIQGNLLGDSDFLSNNPGVNSDIKDAIKDFREIADKFEAYVKKNACVTPESGSIVKVITEHAKAVVNYLSAFQDDRNLSELKSSSSLILGRPGSGKTYAAYTLLKQFAEEEGLSSVAVLSISSTTVTPTGIIGDSVKDMITKVFREGAKGINPLLVQCGYLLIDEVDSLKKKANEQGYKADVQKELLEIVEGGQEIDIDGVRINLSACCRFLAGAFEEEQTLIEKRVDATILANIKSIPKDMLVFLNSHMELDREKYDDALDALGEFGKKFAVTVAGVEGFNALVEGIKPSDFKLFDSKNADYVRSQLAVLSEAINASLEASLEASKGGLVNSRAKVLRAFKNCVPSSCSITKQSFFDQVFGLLNNGFRGPNGKVDFMSIFDCASLIYCYSNAGELIKEGGIGTEIARRSKNTFYVAPLSLEKAVHAATSAFRYRDSQSRYDGKTLRDIFNSCDIQYNCETITELQLEEYVRSLLKQSEPCGYFQYNDVFDILNKDVVYLIQDKNKGKLELRHRDGGLLLAKKNNYIGANGQVSVVEVEFARKHVLNRVHALYQDTASQKKDLEEDGKYISDTLNFLTNLSQGQESPANRRKLDGLIKCYDDLLKKMGATEVASENQIRWGFFDRNIDQILSTISLIINKNASHINDRNPSQLHYINENSYLKDFMDKIKIYSKQNKINMLQIKMEGHFKELGMDLLTLVPQDLREEYKICNNLVNHYDSETALSVQVTKEPKSYQERKDDFDTSFWSRYQEADKDLTKQAQKAETEETEANIRALIKRFEELREKFYYELSKIK